MHLLTCAKLDISRFKGVPAEEDTKPLEPLFIFASLDEDVVACSAPWLDVGRDGFLDLRVDLGLGVVSSLNNIWLIETVSNDLCNSFLGGDGGIETSGTLK